MEHAAPCCRALVVRLRVRQHPGGMKYELGPNEILPDFISSDAAAAKGYLGRQAYETAVKGKNGFVCLVERSWIAMRAATKDRIIIMALVLVNQHRFPCAEGGG